MDGMTPKKAATDEEKIKDPAFVAPEVLASEDNTTTPVDPATVKTTGNKQNWFQRMPRKKKLLIFIPTGVVLLAVAATVGILTTRKKPEPVKPAAPVVVKQEEPPKPTTVAGKLTGVQISPELNQRGVTGVMIENSIDARPQSGLLDAGIVYEAIAEGGITRFLALYQDAQPDYIGPVRSARPYYINWLLPYNASYMHIGGSAEALVMIPKLGIRDMGENGKDNPIQRISTRYAPHNAYTSMAKMDAVRANRGWGNPDFPSLKRKADTPSKTPTDTSIDFRISSTAFYVHYDYDASTNSYKRSEGGAPHTDEKTAKQLNPKVVVALIIPYSINADDIHSDYAMIGSGQAIIYQDGVKQDVRWSKPSANDPLVLQDAAGNPVPINAGQTWFTALGQASLITATGPPAAPAGQ